MPWSIPDPMTLRLEFVAEAFARRQPITQLCAKYGISEKTAHKWLARFRAGGPAALAERSHAPAACPHRTPPAVREAILASRRAHPTWGSATLRGLLQAQHPEVAWPAPSTITTILRAAGLIVPRRRRARAVPGAAAPERTATEPNALWTIDYKGEFVTGDGRWCYPLTLMDSASRFILAIDAQRAIRTTAVRAVLERCFRTFGLPTAILSDNGTPFASVHAPRRFSVLSAWFVQLGIRPLFTTPGHPEHNGRHERMHRTLKAETAAPPARSLAHQQARFEAFRAEFNSVRPHAALARTPPARHYRPSERPWPATMPRLTYPSDYLVRRVAPGGFFNWHTRQVYLSTTLAGHDLGFCPVSATGFHLYLGEYLLGLFDVMSLSFTPLAPPAGSPISPV